MTSLTPNMDAIEPMIARMRADMAAHLAQGGATAAQARVVLRLSEAYTRAMAAEADLRTPTDLIIDAFCVALSNVIFGVARSHAAPHLLNEAIDFILKETCQQVDMRRDLSLTGPGRLQVERATFKGGTQ